MGDSRVRLLGFDSQKTAEVRRLLPGALKKIERIAGRRLKFPSPVLPMRRSEMGRKPATRPDDGHVDSAGRSVWDPKAGEVRVNPFISADDILLSVVQELMHATMKDRSPEEIDQLADEVIQGLRLTERNVTVSLMDRISESLSRDTLHRLRKLHKGKHKPKGRGETKYFPGLTDNDEQPGFSATTGTVSGPASLGPGTFGGVIKHS